MSTLEIVRVGDDLTAIDGLSDATKIAQYSKHLTHRETLQIVNGFESGSYEMVTSYVWSRATTVLRKELAKLGMDFVGEVLGRPDLNADSSPQELSETEAINLAQNLGMVTSTEAMRLRQAQALVTHFNDLDQEQVEEEGVAMGKEEAIACLKACIKNILGVPKIEFAEQLSKFRRDLERRAFSTSDPQMEGLKTSPYFVQKTVLSFLITSIRSSSGAQLQNALHNINVLLPIVWDQLRKLEMWQVGNLYAEMYSDGQSVQMSGLKKALLKVKGFDYVPETTRSNTFAKAAARLMAAHEGLNNFHTEGPAMDELAQLGSTIPMPAFPVCMTSILASFLGRPWGNSWEAAKIAEKIFDTFAPEKWEYYLNECLPADATVLYKIQSEKPFKRWADLVIKRELDTLQIRNGSIRVLLNATKDRNVTKATAVTDKLLLQATPQKSK
jgi:hypothetical protein